MAPCQSRTGGFVFKKTLRRCPGKEQPGSNAVSCFKAYFFKHKPIVSSGSITLDKGPWQTCLQAFAGLSAVSNSQSILTLKLYTGKMLWCSEAAPAQRERSENYVFHKRLSRSHALCDREVYDKDKQRVHFAKSPWTLRIYKRNVFLSFGFKGSIWCSNFVIFQN